MSIRPGSKPVRPNPKSGPVRPGSLVWGGQPPLLPRLVRPGPAHQSCWTRFYRARPGQGRLTPLKVNRSNKLLELVHTDVCSPINIRAYEGYEYFITFTDDHSRYGYVYLIHHKSDSFEKLKEYRTEVEKQLGKPVKAIRSDRGGEYLSN